ncbi:pentatricopeptide repeat-containing protein At5g39680 [Aristolochia californica]|uniref:pentatricopeptide repeat-containing protein At5g39680 n=1 Tax=Aristolochia californica TaxID=171875 RepID=UPI0035DB3AEE
MRAGKLALDALSVLPSSTRRSRPSKNFTAPDNSVKFCQAIHADLIKKAHSGSTTKVNTLINSYVKSGLVASAIQLFNEMPERNLVSWSTLIAGYFHNGLSSEALALFVSMNNGSHSLPNEYVFSTVISSCADMQALQEGKQCHAYVMKSGFIFHSYVGNALINMYSRCSDMESALDVFKAIARVDCFSYNLLISGFLDQGNLKEAWKVLGKMVKGSIEWDPVTYATAFGLCGSSKDFKLGLQVHGQILTRNVELDVYMGSAVVDMYGKCGNVISARNVFDRLLCRNVVSWTTMMTVYAHSGCFEESLNFYFEMESAGVRPNELTCVIILNSCASLSALRHGDLLNSHFLKLGFGAHLVVGNALINMYSKCGSIEDAYQIFLNMPHRDIVSWNSMISGYSHHSLGFKALQLFHQMSMTFERPNYVTFVGALSACAHLGLVDEGFYYLNHLMKDMGIAPGVEHYTCMIGLLSRSGQLDVAEELMRSSPVQWDVVAWRTLLSACQVHRNFGLGRRVAEIILQLDPNDVGTHILLSNMYAKAKRWDGVAKIRTLMRGKEIKKEPGVSWIQVRSHTHVFVSEDRNHPQSALIYKKLAELIAEIKLVGYVPDFDNALHDVEDEQKEESLRYHSEKLAITFGLITLPARAPVHVIKNLRICEDCHTAAKLISDVTRRKIIIRDANRFHCFQGGICACGDYW